MTADRIELVVLPADAGVRLDVFLARHVAGISRRAARILIDLGGVFVERRRTKVASRAVRPGQQVLVVIGGAFARAAKRVGGAARARDRETLLPWEILHRDSHLVVVDKPSGLLTAPTPESDRNNLADLLAHDGVTSGRVYVVHRLDRETSGLLVLALTPEANRGLSEIMRRHAAERAYQVVVEGEIGANHTVISEPVRGRAASTELRQIRLARGRSLLEARLHTGRQHQIRIHCRAIGHPVVADSVYGVPAAEPAPPRPALHAHRLGFEHPVTGEALRFERDWPPDMVDWLVRSGLRDRGDA